MDCLWPDQIPYREYLTDAGKVLTTPDFIKYVKSVLCALLWILMGHIVCKEGMLVNPTKIVVIVDLPKPMIVK